MTSYAVGKSAPKRDYLAETKACAQAFDKASEEVYDGIPRKGLIIITCMDARIDAYKIHGLKRGDAHVLRNAGGNARDAIRSIVISQQLLKTTEIQIVKHTNCGMPSFTSRDINAKIVESHNVSASHIDFQPFEHLVHPGYNASQEELEIHKRHELRILRQEVLNDIHFLRGHELVIQQMDRSAIPTITGYILDIEKDPEELIPVEEY